MTVSTSGVFLTINTIILYKTVSTKAVQTLLKSYSFLTLILTLYRL